MILNRFEGLGDYSSGMGDHRGTEIHHLVPTWVLFVKKGYGSSMDSPYARPLITGVSFSAYICSSLSPSNLSGKMGTI